MEPTPKAPIPLRLDPDCGCAYVLRSDGSVWSQVCRYHGGLLLHPLHDYKIGDVKEISFTSFIQRWVQAQRAQQRRGQYLFNLLFHVRPDLAEGIRTTRLDPFYQDDTIPQTLTWLRQHWNDHYDWLKEEA